MKKYWVQIKIVINYKGLKSQKVFSLSTDVGSLKSNKKKRNWKHLQLLWNSETYAQKSKQAKSQCTKKKTQWIFKYLSSWAFKSPGVEQRVTLILLTAEHPPLVLMQRDRDLWQGQIWMPMLKSPWWKARTWRENNRQKITPPSRSVSGLRITGRLWLVQPRVNRLHLGPVAVAHRLPLPQWLLFSRGRPRCSPWAVLSSRPTFSVLKCLF